MHNAHVYYLLLSSEQSRDRVLRDLAARGINAVFHYMPLHSSQAGRRYGRSVGDLPVTVAISRRLLRLPLWVGMSDYDLELVVDATLGAVELAAGESRTA